MDLILILIELISGIAFLFLAFKILMPFFHGINNPLNGATRFMLVLTLIGFGFNLFEFSQGGAKIIEYYFTKTNFLPGLGIYLILMIIALCTAMVLFRISSGIISIIFKENIKVELVKNNILVAGTFGMVFLFIILLLKPHLLGLSLFYIQ